MLKITNSITGDELQVANQDFSDEMTWEDAKRACNELGSGWRLPNKQELLEIYEKLHEKGQGNFKAACYWSSTETDADSAWYFYFSDGTAGANGNKGIATGVRAVRAF